RSQARRVRPDAPLQRPQRQEGREDRQAGRTGAGSGTGGEVVVAEKINASNGHTQILESLAAEGAPGGGPRARQEGRGSAAHPSVHEEVVREGSREASPLGDRQ